MCGAQVAAVAAAAGVGCETREGAPTVAEALWEWEASFDAHSVLQVLLLTPPSDFSEYHMRLQLNFSTVKCTW